MARRWLPLLLALSALALPAGSAASGVDKGKSRPPTNLTEEHKAIWMTEWVACWRPKTLLALAKELKIKNPKIITPQQGARMLSVRAMRFLYEDPEQLKTAREGCRNGILWRFYHGE